MAKTELKIGWKKGARFTALDATRVYHELEAIRLRTEHESFEPGDVLAAVKAGAAPEIAKAIEGDDHKAAESWRLEQVKAVIRGLSVVRISVKVTSAPEEPPRRAVVLVHPEPGLKGYLPRPVALRDHAEELRQRAVQGLHSWLLQYGDVPGLGTLVEGVTKLVEQHTSPLA